MKQAFIVIDVQNDFCPGGALPVPDGDAVVPVINRLLPKFAESGDCIVLTQDWHPADHLSFASQHAGQAPFGIVELPYGKQTLWPNHCVQGTKGAEFHKNIPTDRAHAIIRKGFRREIDSYSAFFENDGKTPTGLQMYLQELEIERVVLAGLATDYCVKYSAMDGRVCGFEVTIIEDACRAIDLGRSLTKNYQKMKSAGVEFATAENFIADNFKSDNS